MTITSLSGPMFEPSKTTFWESINKKEGAHYNTYWLRDDSLGMEALRLLFPGGEADEFNLCLFSTSGVHGMYTTIEEIEASLTKYGSGPHPWSGDDYPNDYVTPNLTFLVIHPRIVCLRYGNADVTLDDVPFLKALRASSAVAFAKIGLAR